MVLNNMKQEKRFSPDKLSTDRTECWLLEECSHELMAVNLMNATFQGVASLMH